MPECKYPLRQSFLVAITLFLTLLCVVLGIIHHANYRDNLYSHYQQRIEDVLNYAAQGIDGDDLSQCIKSGVESEKYQELQTYLDGIRDGMDIHFVYVIVPLNTEERDNIKNVIAGISREEYETIPDELVQLNQLTGDSYSPETAAKYLEAYNSGKLTFFENVTEWGDDYTGLLPLCDSNGERYAALCVDVEISSIHEELDSSTRRMVATVLLLGVLFDVLLLLWVRRSVTTPIAQLERSVVSYAAQCRDQKDPEALKLEVPEIHTQNEIETLSHAFIQMSEAMQNYVRSTARAESALAKMEVLANKDSLTSVRNKTAFDAFAQDLQSRLLSGETEFALLVADLNDLKKINDSYGHDCGDIYIKRGCHVICRVFAHSPVFRVGGDEFVVVLRGHDYVNRTELLEQARRELRDDGTNADLRPWERCSMAIGMAVCRGGTDLNVEDILKRADQEMYLNKRQMKGQEPS